MIKELQNLEELDNIIEKDSAILKVYTTWCGPCKLLKPEYEKAENEGNNVTFLLADAEQAVDIAKKYAVNTVPTVIFFKNKIEVARFVGFRTKSAIIDFINEHK